jgi:ABC-2 type transport system ATP-binding protein
MGKYLRDARQRGSRSGAVQGAALALTSPVRHRPFGTTTENFFDLSDNAWVSSHKKPLPMPSSHLAAPSDAIVSVRGVSKTYAGGFQALKRVDLDIRRGEIFALLGPNGAGKTTLISLICGMTNATEGTVIADGHNIVSDYRAARATIGLVPQELHTDSFETVWATVNFSRGLFGKPPNPALIEKILKDLSLWDKKDTKIMALSGGMKRRVLIAKALSHEPKILFLDEPSAGVDVELRHDMWRLVRELRDAGTTIILTTHYIEEAEDMADRIGVIRKGELILVEDKNVLMRKLGKKQLTLTLQQPLDTLPDSLKAWPLEIAGEGTTLVYTFDTQQEDTGIAALLRALAEQGIDFKDLHSSESSLEEIFVSLVHDKSQDQKAPQA